MATSHTITVQIRLIPGISVIVLLMGRIFGYAVGEWLILHWPMFIKVDSKPWKRVRLTDG